MKTKIYLARHGETQWNKARRFQGTLDSELTLLGKQQSKKIALQLANKQIDLIVSSSLGRAIASAKICQQKLTAPVASLNGFDERDLGHWQGKNVDDIKSDKNYHEIFHQFTELTPLNGESALKCGERIYQTLELLLQNNQNKNLLIIFHGEALRCLLAKLGNNSADSAYQLFDNGCVLELIYTHQNSNFQLTR